jgi:hypothetical protein
MLYLRGCGGLFTRGGTLQQEIEVCGQLPASSCDNQQITALSKLVTLCYLPNCIPLLKQLIVIGRQSSHTLWMDEGRC